MSKDNNDADSIKKHILDWSDQHEKILAEWADKAMCYRWLHSKSEQKYSRRSKLFTIPVIILSTMTGTANFAIERIPEDYQSAVQVGIGSLNILAGIITTVQQFLKINELNESHRIASISWGKFYRNLKTELLKNRKERYDVSYLIKTAKEEFDRLVETSPPVDTGIIRIFKKNFNDTNQNISKPEICDSLQPTSIVIYKTCQEDIEESEASKIVQLIKAKQDSINKQLEVEDFIKKFKKEYSRNPTTTEVYENLQDKVNKETINKVINNSQLLNKRMTKTNV